MSKFNEQLPKWDNIGTEPPASKKAEGWQVQEKPPAGWINWLFNRSFKCIEELQEKAVTIDEADFASRIEFDAHKVDTMPHRFIDNGKIYRWGLSVNAGIVMFNYEEVL